MFFTFKTRIMKNNLALIFLLIFFGVQTCPAQTVGKQVLKSHNPSLLKSIKPIGAMHGDSLMDIIIELPLRNEEAMMKKYHDLYDPASHDFRQFLTPAEFTEAYGPTEKDYQELLNFAASNKLKIINAPKNRALLHIEAPAKIIEKVFHVKMLTYKNPKNGMEFHAPSGDATLMVGLRNLQIFGLNDFGKTILQKSGMTSMRKLDDEPLHSKMDVGTGPNGNYIGYDFRNAYAPDVPFIGSGQTIGIVTKSDFYTPDIKAYELQAGLPDVAINRVYIDGMKQFLTPPPGNKCFGNFDPEVEVSMDIEMAISMAPGAQITVYGEPPGKLTGDILNEIANPSQGEAMPNQIGTSITLDYGGDDSPRVYHAYMQMCMQGQSFFAYSGDNGAYGDNSLGSPLPFSPGDFPYVVSVGGTMLTMKGNGSSWLSENSWSLSGGGPSPWFTIPPFQQGISNSRNLASTTMRSCPDVSMPASNVFVISNAGDRFGCGGTSSATPLWAGFMALVNEQASLHNLPPVGFLDWAIYEIGRLPSYKNCFHDINDNNNNSTSGNPKKYQAVDGYDQVTGWGSPNGMTLINALALRMPDPLDVAIKYVPAEKDGCDPGPIAGTSARYHAFINAGTGPYSFAWRGQNGVNIEEAIHLNPDDAIVTVPALGQSGTLNLTVTDANGSKFTTKITVTGIDPQVAANDYAACKFFQRVKIRFPIPIYIDPGDPYRKFQQTPFTGLQLKEIQTDVNQLSELLKKMQPGR
jgi:subtilase family serine protease